MDKRTLGAIVVGMASGFFAATLGLSFPAAIVLILLFAVCYEFGILIGEKS